MYEYLYTASISCCDRLAVDAIAGRNSLVSYLLRIHNSFSSRLEPGFGLVRLGRTLDSHTEFAMSLPIANITLICDSLYNKITKQTHQIMLNT